MLERFAWSAVCWVWPSFCWRVRHGGRGAIKKPAKSGECQGPWRELDRLGEMRHKPVGMSASAEHAPRTGGPAPFAWNRWAVLLSLAGLASLLPAYFVPAMLVANAVDGPRWYSVWTGIRDFHAAGHHYLAALIFTFSMVFPLLKLMLCLVCAAAEHRLPHRLRTGMVTLTTWSAKYSMLDVLVIAMAIMLVKVGDYVRVLPSMGLYLFSFAILCSAAGGSFLRRSLRQEARGIGPPASNRRAALWLLAPAAALTAWGSTALAREQGGEVRAVRLTRLTQRGELKRSVEKTLALKELLKEEHRLLSKDTWRRLLEFSQAVSTDAGWQTAEVHVVIDKKDGGTVTSAKVGGMDFDAAEVAQDFTLPEAVAWDELAAVKLVSTVKYAGLIDAPIEEEHVSLDADPFRVWTRQWHGRIFSFELSGPRGRGFVPAAWAAGAGGLLLLWALSGLLCGSGTKRAREGAGS